jgi:ankyrin repeat protein
MKQFQFIDYIKNRKYHEAMLLLKTEMNAPSDIDTTLETSSEEGKLHIVQMLINNIQENTIDSKQEYGYKELFIFLLEEVKINPSQEDSYSIRFASKNGLLDIVKLLLNDNRVDVHVHDDFPLHMASQFGHVEIVKLLLNHKKKYVPKNNFSLSMASKNGHIKIIKLLLENEYIDPSYDDNWCIFIAYKNGHTDIVDLLWMYKKVRNTLQKNNPKIYNKLIKKETKQKIKSF